ncbi:MAG: hypothetical protein ACOYYS_05730 [Chloroflexota bacterium]
MPLFSIFLAVTLVAVVVLLTAISYAVYRVRIKGKGIKGLVLEDLFIYALMVVIGLIIGVPFTVKSFSFEEVRVIFFSMVTAAALLIQIYITFHKPDPGETILLDLGGVASPVWSIWIMFFGSLCLILFVAITRNWKNGDILIGVSFLFSTLSILIYSKEKRIVTPKGIWLGQTYIKWEQIRTYEWLKVPGKDIMLLSLKSHFPLFNTVRIRVTHDVKERLVELMEHRIGEKTS